MSPLIGEDRKGGSTGRPFFSIFIPTFNRARLLPRALESIEAQTFRDFDVVVVDDGSTDETRALVTEWAQKVPFPVRYHWQVNQGKAAAHNAALPLLEGELTVTLDSDDALAPRALEILKDRWESIPEERRASFAGVEGLCAYRTSGGIVGDSFPGDVWDANFLEMRRRQGVRGDKKGAIRTDILKEYPFPTIKGETYLRESVIWNRIALRYCFRYVNDIIQFVEYEPDGMTRRGDRLALASPHGQRLAFLEHVNVFSEFFSRRELRRSAVKYVRYSLHAGVGLRAQVREVRDRKLWLSVVAKGTFYWLRDRVRLALDRTP